MAKEPKQIILIPELDNEEGQFQLLLQTRKHSFNGHIESTARGQYAKGGMVTTVMGLGSAGYGDFCKTYFRATGTATQRRLDLQHADVFNAATIPAIVLEVNEFYQQKRQREEKDVAVRAASTLSREALAEAARETVENDLEPA